ncbi:hypothetical protein [Myxococcus xanthus]|uniref:hypothetical protein n=1 Tax=Myxococcus xanthus TaxID=34 RepID=UPI00112C5F0E|nr:hypothetical protein [Myxococcus xanthus]QDE83351.1 hypothetical protein BHS07_18285 [Myxococcus xanthus]
MTTKFPCGHDSLTSEYCANCNNAYHLGQYIRHALKSDNDRLLRAVAGLSEEERGKLRELVGQQPPPTPEEVAQDYEMVSAGIAAMPATGTVARTMAAAVRLRDQAVRVLGLEGVLTAAGVDSKVSLNADDEETEYRTDVVSRVQWLVEDRERIREQRRRLLAGDTGAVECDCRRPAIWGSMPRKDCGACGGSGYLRHRAGYGASHPAPTAGTSEVVTSPAGGRIRTRGAQPTPPPGLLEAVEPFLCLLRDMAALALSDDSPAHLSTRPVEDVTLGDVRALLAAYDAAKGGEHGPDSTCPNCKADHEDAAKYRAAEERLNNHAGQAKAAHDSWGSDPDGAVARWVLFGDGEAPAPREMLSKARVVDVLRKWLPPTHAVFEDLGLDTPPSGPGGGEPPSRNDVLSAFAVEADPAGALERYQRENPALAEELAELARDLAQPLVEQEGPLPPQDAALIDKAWTQHAAIKPKPTVDLWPMLTAFSAEMRRLLDHHRPRKGGHEGWVRDMPAALLRRVREEADEVELGLAARVSPEVLLARCADVGNMAMMTADAYAHQRARMTPGPAEPLIEGPVDEPPATPDLHAEHCTPDECKYGEGRACTMWHDPALEGKPPQRVVWEDQEVRVLANGTLLIFGPHGWGQPLTKTMRLQRLARALAKAKFDARLARASLASSEEALRQKDKAVAEDTQERVARMVENVGLKNLASVIRAAPLRGKAVRRG